jgi:single-strand DNA-binding protein
MKLSINKLLLGGNLTRDPELRVTSDGTYICTGSLAVNKKWKGKDGQMREKVSFIEFSMFGRSGEVVAEYFRKGDPILLDGELQMDEWEDKQSGERKTKLKMLANSFSFCGPTAKAGEQKQKSVAHQETPGERVRRAGRTEAAVSAGAAKKWEDEEENQCPF